MFWYRNGFTTLHLNKDALNKIQTEENKEKTLADLVALNIGQIGENIVLQRASLFSTNIIDNAANDDDMKLAVVTHPSASPGSDTNSVAYGRFGVIMAYSKNTDVGILPEGQTVSKYLCYMIVLRGYHTI